MSRFHLEVREMPGVITESARAVFAAHGLTVTPEILREIGNNATQALASIDENPENWPATDSIESPWRPTDGAPL